jgi:carbon storage regulator
VLVLSRKSGQAIVIDGGIRITVVGIHGKTIRLAIEAPRTTRVDREEVAERVARDGFRVISTATTGLLGPGNSLDRQAAPDRRECIV